ncbi:MAG: hypothetical protein K6E72_00790 [Saccharofermentans sp.]|jgi:hypothetical protein|nr:hypothetical protein [Saccharofermentans sp.]
MELNKCPNCNGKLELAPSRKRMICPYCGSEFTLDDTTKEEIGDNPIHKDWFIYEWDYQKLTENPKYNVPVNAFVRTLNEFDSAEKIEQYMRDFLFKFDEISAPGIREKNYADIAKRLSGSMTPGEHIICYNDDGIFVRGKTGVVITNKRTVFVDKKSFKDIMHSAVPYMLFGYSVGLPEIKLGEQYANNIGIFNSHFDLMGTAAALICTLAFEQNPDRPKIRLTSNVK